VAKSRSGSRGSALLAVLWLSAALAAIAFAIATNVRGEIERTSTAVDSLRCYYLATGSIDRALLHIQWGGKYFLQPAPTLRFSYPSGEAVVEIIPETAKISINRSVPQDLQAAVLAVGAPPDQAALITRGILDWRAPAAGGSFTEFDQYYLSLKPSFRASHASFQEIEELLLVRGMTPELFHGRYERTPDGRLVPVAGLKDVLSVYGAVGGFDVNTSAPALMRAIGVSPQAVDGIVAQRRVRPIKSMGDLGAFNDGSPGFSRLGVTVSPICTLRATARLRLPNGQLSDVQHSVSAMIRFLGLEYNPPYHIMRWYDSAYSTQ
jgi:general secretion pathway protein K